jgi:hypothetical protein
LTLVEVRDDDWPLSTMAGEEEAVGATRAELTVTETALEVTVFEALSVTLSSNDQVPGAERAPVEMVGSEAGVQPDVKEPPKLL